MKLERALFFAAVGVCLFAGVAIADEPQGQDSTTQKPAKHHSMGKGALVGGAGGAVMGGKKGAVAGAAGGAAVQHHRNHKEQKKAEKGE
jgi:hypothetical protein